MGRVATAIAREAAAASLVLLRNEGVLPLPTSVRSVAVIGPDAAPARLGGYSVLGVASVSIVEGLRVRLGDRVRYVAGPGRASLGYVPIPAGRLNVQRTSTAESARGPIDLAVYP